jgi:adenosylmethionine---8-amino-7-oxononanoate aminotransferase
MIEFTLKMSTQDTFMPSQSASLLDRDLKHVWHPCSQMKDFEQAPPIEIIGAQGAYLHTPQGPLIDAISSWWCKPLGHQHPAIIEAIQTQLHQFEHGISANTTHTNLVLLAEKLSQLSNLPYSLFASDGACAVEIALKLTLQARKIQGQPHKTQFLSFKNGYHGETFGTLSISDIGRFKEPYLAHCTPSAHIELPYTYGLNDPLSLDASLHWVQLLPQLEAMKETLTAIIFEPVIQGAGGMKTYSVDFLNRVMAWAKANHIYCIADEIMTGLCRTGRWFATDYTNQQPDIMCLSKGLTAGALPLSATLISQSLFDLFYDDFENNHNFLHSHTHSGNALAVSAAVATLQTLETEGINEQATLLQTQMRQAFNWLKETTGKLSNIRGIGGIIAADLMPSPHPRTGFRFYQEALKRGALIRPIGQTLYWLPPLTISQATLEKLTQITYESIQVMY